MRRQRVRHITHRPAGQFRLLAHGDAVEQHIARGRLLDGGDDAHGGGFARAIGPDKPEDVTGIEREGNIVHGHRPAEFLPQIVYLDFHGVAGESRMPYTTAVLRVRLALAAEPSAFSIKGLPSSTAMYVPGWR